MRKALILSALVVLVAAGCGKSNDTTKASTGGSAPVKLSGTTNAHGQKDLGSATTLEIEQDDFYFSPTYVKAQPGSSVKVELKNEGKNAHTFTIDSLNISKQVAPGGSAEVDVKLPSSGVVTFYCEFHQGMGMQGAFYFKAGTAATNSGTSRRSNY
jgi:plastocyanin